MHVKSPKDERKINGGLGCIALLILNLKELLVIHRVYIIATIGTTSYRSVSSIINSYWSQHVRVLKLIHL